MLVSDQVMRVIALRSYPCLDVGFYSRVDYFLGGCHSVFGLLMLCALHLISLAL